MDEKFAHEGVVESGLAMSNEGMLHCSGFSGGRLNGKDNGGEVVIVAFVVPPSDGQFTFGWSELQKLSVFGNSICLSVFHPSFCRSGIHVCHVIWFID